MDESAVTPSLWKELVGLSEPLVVVDADFRIVHANEAQLRLSGGTLESYVGVSLWDVLDPASPDSAVFRAAYERCMRERVTVELESAYGPSAMYVRARVCPLSNGGMAIFFRDVTAQRRSEQERSQFAAYRQLALDAAQMGWWSFDPVTETARCDRRTQEIFGLEQDTLDLEAMTATVHPEDRPRFLTTGRAVLSGARPGPTHLEFRALRPDGTVRWVESRGLATFEGGRATMMVGTFLDITERKQHDDALQRAHKAEETERLRLQTVLEALPTGVMIIDAQGFPQQFNAAFRALWGGPPFAGTIHDARPWKGYWPETGQPVKNEEWAVHRALTTGQPVVGDVVEIERFDGSGRALMLNSAAPIRDADGKVIGGVVSQVDLTAQRENELALGRSEARTREALLQLEEAIEETRETEARLRQVQKMEAVGQLAGGVAHDFNNLLTVILAGTEFLDDGLPAGHALHEEVGEIRKAGQRAASLVRQLLAFSRKQVLEPRVVDLNEVLRGLEGLFKRLLGENLHLVLLLDPRLHLCKLDTGQLEQVLVNLVVNARDAMGEGGRITIETSNVTLEGPSAEFPEEPRGEYVRVVISDTGAGMTPEVQRRIFEPFFTTKEPGRGTGLGLSTVYGIVRQSGGDVAFTSAPGEGTTFRLLFPRAPGEKRELTPTGTKRALREATETVLLVEDDEQVRVAVEGMLRRAGYRVLAAASGDEAIFLSEQQGPAIDVLVTDVVMPRMSGKKLAETLRQSRPGLKVLFMSGYNEDLSGHGGPNVHFIGKPMSSEALLTRLREVLED